MCGRQWIAPPHQGEQVANGDVAGPPRVRRLLVALGDQQAQPKGMDLELERGVELERLTVDADVGLA